jgi:hypothetical protein
MPPSKREALEHLLREIERAQIADDTRRELLARVRSELIQTLDQPEAHEADHQTLMERLNEAVYALESEHSTLATAMNAVITTLSNAGL